MIGIGWLQQDDGKWRHVGDSSERLTLEQTLGYVQELYQAGAVSVFAERLQGDDDIESGDSLRVLLPQDPQRRAVLFSIGERILRETGLPFDPEGEQGQKFSRWAGKSCGNSSSQGEYYDG